MTPADLDALVARLKRDSIRINGAMLLDEAAAALAELRDSEALARGKIAEQMIEIARLTTKCKYGDPMCPCQDGDACHYEGDNPMTPPPIAALKSRIAALEAENARLKDALRQANGVRDVFASAVVAQAMQDIDPAKVKPCDCVRPEIHGHQLLCKHGNLEAERDCANDRAATHLADAYSMRGQRDALRASLDRIVSAYDAYRGKGMLPAPNQYAMLVAAIDAAKEKP